MKRGILWVVSGCRHCLSGSSDSMIRLVTVLYTQMKLALICSSSNYVNTSSLAYIVINPHYVTCHISEMVYPPILMYTSVKHPGFGI